MGKAKLDGRHTQDYNQELKFMPLATWSLITVKPAFRYKQRQYDKHQSYLRQLNDNQSHK